MVQIKRQLTNTTNKYAGVNGKRFIVVHQTGNTDVGADAQRHANLQSNGNVRQASWHWQVDDKVAIQSFAHNIRCWHAGDGRAPNGGNYNGIAVEICINQDGDYNKAVQNGAELVAHIMKEEGIPIQNVKQHYHMSGKNCPAQIRANKNGINWTDFINMVQHPKEDDEVEKAIVIGGYPDLTFAELVSIRLQAPIYFRSALPSGKIAKEVYVVGGGTAGLQADKIINLTGANRFEVARKVDGFLG